MVRFAVVSGTGDGVPRAWQYGDRREGKPGEHELSFPEDSMKYTFENTTSAPIVTIVEPWAEEFSVPPGSTLEIEISATDVGPLETSMSDEYFVVWLWSGCRATVSLNGEELPRPGLSVSSP
jgi:hypothetical protein